MEVQLFATPEYLDLLQVDLLSSGASLVWPWSGWPRATKSWEVDLPRLMGFHLHFAPKMRNSVTCIWGFRFHLWVLTSMAECANSLRPNLLNVCVYLHHRRSKFVYFVRTLSLTMILGENWWPQGAGKKIKICFNLESTLGAFKFFNFYYGLKAIIKVKCSDNCPLFPRVTQRRFPPKCIEKRF